MIVLGGDLRPLGNSVAFVELALDDAVEAYRVWGKGWAVAPTPHRLPAAPIHDLLSALLPLVMPYDRRLLVGSKTRWTAIFDNSRVGGDPFPATGLGRRRDVHAVAATHVPEAPDALPATQFHLFGPEGEPPLRYVRTVDSGIFDEGRWRFDTSGQVQPYEDLEAYARSRVQDRFTREMLIRYLAALDIWPDDPSWYTQGVLADVR